MHTILVVDDSMVNHKLIHIMLHRKAYKIASAYNGQEAIEYLSSQPPVDMLITDLNMPLMDGLSLIEHLRAEAHYKKIPIIVITASGREVDQRKAVEKGASALLTQPFSSLELTQLVSQYIG